MDDSQEHVVNAVRSLEKALLTMDPAETLVVRAALSALEGLLPRHVCEKCGKVFTRQDNRHLLGERRMRRFSGVTYCSSRCARAAAQKKYYEREKAKRG